MKILFIENREKTAFWEQVALRLQQLGHEISWLVQNPVFTPAAFARSTSVRVLPFPGAGDLHSPPDEEAYVREHYPALATDRGRRHFGGGASHYAYYAQQIKRSLAELQPDLVVGESTLFHELIAIDCCRTEGIPFVQPVANRYPRGRFSLFQYDTQVPIGGSGESMPDAEALTLAERIATGHEVPFYMRVPAPMEKALVRTRWAFTRGRVWWGRLGGERYNTPSLHRKFALAREVRANLERWQKHQRVPAVPTRTLLYPLQLQPEANIDVWGRPHSDQVEVLRKMLAAAPTNVQVAVKGNPKTKYELTDDLLSMAESEPRLCLLPLTMTMPDSLARVTGAITVSGTIGLEAIFGKGRCLSMRHPIIEEHFSTFHAKSVAAGVQRLLQDPTVGVGSATLGAGLLKRLVATSFRGLVSDPLSHPACMDEQNINAVAEALERALLRRVSQTQRSTLPASSIPAGSTSSWTGPQDIQPIQ